MLSRRSLRSLFPAVVLLPALFALLPPVVGAEQAQDLVVNGSFEADADGDGWPDRWPKGNGVSVVREGGNAWLRLDGPSGVTQTIRIQPDWWKLKLTCRMRATDVVMGKDGWQDGRLAMNFVDEKGAHLDPWPNVFHAQGTTDWIECEREYKIPAGAASLHLQPGMMGASGRVEFDDIRLVVTRLRSKGKEDLLAPESARNLWSMDTAWRRKSATRESICLNDLWRFLPLGQPASESVPGVNEGWGWFKVPGIWPRAASGDAQEVLLSDYVEEQVELSRCDQAWYRRDIRVPAEWRGRRVQLDFGMVQTHARVFLEGRPAGEVWFPGGLLDVTEHARPGVKQELAVLVTARPTESESQVFMAPDRIVKSQARVELKGLTGDVFLVSEPAGDALGDIHVIPSVREKRITLDTAVRVSGQGPFRLQAVVLEGGKPVKRFESAPFRPADVTGGRFSFSAPWADAKLWDLDAPGNLYDVVVTLRDAAGKVVDETLPRASASGSSASAAVTSSSTRSPSTCGPSSCAT